MLNKVNLVALKIMEIILCISGSISSILIITGAFMRYVLGKDFFGMDEFIMLAAFWLYFIGSCYASWEDSHINADLVTSFVKNPKALKILKIIKYSLSIAISAVTMYWCYQCVMWNIEKMPTTAVYRIPVIASQIPILISFIMMTIYLFMHLIIVIKDDGGKDGEN